MFHNGILTLVEVSLHPSKRPATTVPEPFTPVQTEETVKESLILSMRMSRSYVPGADEGKQLLPLPVPLETGAALDAFFIQSNRFQPK